MSTGVWIPVALIAALALQAAVRGRRELRTWLGYDPAPRARLLRALALALCALCVGSALVRALDVPLDLSGSGSDVVLLVDVSRSMDVTDVAPSRLRRALRTAERVVREAEGMRFALAVFAGEGFIALPLTQDRDALLTYLRALDSDTISVRGSELGRGLAAGARAFDPRSSRARTLLLLTDGESFAGVPDGQLDALRELGVRVVGVGFGTAQGGAVPGQAALAEAVRLGETVVSRRDDALLRRIAGETGGVYFREIEERPQPAELLPPRDAPEDPQPDERRDPLLPWVVAAACALALELWLSGEPGLARLVPRRLFARRRARALAAAGLASALLAFGPGSDWLAEGDAELEAGRAEAALALYREAERTRGDEPATQIRIGNALYRLERIDPAASAYLEALRALGPADHDARFAASFNLGNTLVAKKHYEEARDAYWAALLARPDSVEAKFNYEWTQERIAEQPPPPESEPSPNAQREDPEPEPQPSQSAQSQAQSELRPPEGSLDEQEAQRWLDTLEEPIAEALRQEITNEFGGRPRARPGGKTW